MASKYIFIIFIAYFSKFSVYGNTCADRKTCSDCISDSSVCVWCANPDDKFSGDRCKSENSYESSWCPSHLQNPQSEIINSSPTAQSNLDFSSGARAVQTKPQSYNINLRPGQSLPFQFAFRAAKDYPVDLYFLLDASNDIAKTKDDLVDQSQKIYETLNNLTQNTYMGYGTYIEKKTLPFISNNMNELSYSFKHQLKLMNNYTKFQGIVKNTTFGKNRDPPEAGLDALAQVLACNETIGWREKSSKIVVLVTSGTLHKAGDGRTGGIFEPYDGQCHTDNTTGSYTEELNFDYPSVGAINQLASKRKATIIFLVTKPKYNEFYKRLTGAIRGSRLVLMNTTKGNDDQELVNILGKTYKDIRNTVKFVATNPNYKIEFRTVCTKADCTEADCTKDDCKVEIEETKLFKGNITLLKNIDKSNEIIDISILGIEDKLTLNVTIIKKCTCENDAKTSAFCHGQILQCGICMCEGSKKGKRCNCDTSSSMTTNIDDDTTCKHIRSDHTEDMCNGRKATTAYCECGHCICGDKSGFFGKYCQYDNRNCIRDAEVLCSGHGICMEHKEKLQEYCKCEQGWIGEECDCRNSTAACSHKEGGKTKSCNGLGDCICNECKCHDPASWDKRIERDSKCRPKPCSDCHSLQCNAARSCAFCHLASENCQHKCDGIILEEKHHSIPLEYLNSNEWMICDHEKFKIGCYTRFIYKYDDDNYKLLIRVEENEDCAESYYLYGGVLLATLLLAGIATLLAWKCITSYQDRKEFETFEKKHAEILSGACVNPLYDAPEVRFNNPTFEGTGSATVADTTRQRKTMSYAKRTSNTMFKNPTFEGPMD